MKFQATTLAFLTAFSVVTAENGATKTRRLRRGDARFKTKSKSRNAQSVFFPEGGQTSSAGPTPTRPADKNIVMLLIDDVSTERFPDTGNEALKGKMPGLTELKEDGAVFYPHFYSSSSICAPAQSAMFAGMDPGDLGSHQQFSHDKNAGKEHYATVPPAEVQFIPEYLRGMGYYTSGGGKLDYQVATVVPTFYNKILGGTYTDINSYMEQAWTVPVERGMPFMTMLNMMDNHENLSSMTRELPILLTDSLTGEFPDLPNGKFGYATDKNLNFRLKPGSEGTWAPVVRTDIVNVDITGYNGAFDETTLTHANGGLPGYVMEDIGIQSIWAREYDLLRNADWRISQVIKRLKEEGLYDDTVILIFGDHGSASFKGKLLLQPTSVQTPLWVKLPKDVPPSPSVETGPDGYLTDTRMMPMKDAFPTILSILGKEPEPWMKGKARAGKFEEVGFEYDVAFSMVARQGTQQGWKSFAAYNKEFFYQRHKLTEDAVNEREAMGIEDPAVIADAREDGKYASKYSGWKNPAYNRMKRLMYINAENVDFDDKFRYLTTDDCMPPAEVLFDLRTDPWATENILMEYTYTPIYGDQMQTWGNFVKAINVEYGPVDLSRLDDDQLDAYNMLKDALLEWIESLSFATDNLNWAEGLYGEENDMARAFWPDGTEPETEIVVLDPETGALESETEGTVYMYSVNNAEEREKCDQIGTAVKESIASFTPMNSGLPTSSYTSFRNGKTYSGFMYSDDMGKELSTSMFLGGIIGCTIFISEDGTFMEAVCPTWTPFSFDTRDGMWDGETWVGVDPDTGEWTSDPVTVWDEDALDWNYAVLGPYFFGPNRDAVYSGTNADGSEFVPTTARDTPYNRGYKPAPKYWLVDDDPYTIPAPIFSDEGFGVKGWSLTGGSFDAVSNPDEDPDTNTKGTFTWSLAVRFSQLPRNEIFAFLFDSFNHACLFWEVGTEIDIDMSKGDPNLYIFTQGCRKGYGDSKYQEFVVEG